MVSFAIQKASLIAQLVKNPPAMQETWFNSWVGKICWKRIRLPIPVFLGFSGGSAGKESACNAGDLDSLDWEHPLEKGKAIYSSILALEFLGLYGPWGHKELDTTEQLSLHLLFKSF